MDNLELEKTVDIECLMGATNIVPLLDPKDVDAIGKSAVDGYMADKNSRAEWDQRMATANKLALQVYEQKSYPWPQASSVKFPLITVAALQYNAKAYPSLVNDKDLVKARVIGLDPTGQKTRRAERIGTHMTWQNIEQDEGWEEDHDKLLLVQPIAGCAFKKRIYEPGPGKQQARLILPGDFFINYYTKNLHDSPRYTHVYDLTPNKIRQREMDGRFAVLDVDPSGNINPTEVEVARDERQGIQPSPPDDDKLRRWFTGEQYCWIDLDGDDYQEPYIVTFDINTGCVRRIVARYLPGGIKKRSDKVYKIDPVKVFTKYPFIPSPDGGFYDLGLGSLLGPINESVNTAINQLFDAGTMATLGGGFLGRGFKSKGGAITFAPNQWYPVDAPGDDLRKNILPLPVREPSNVLLQLLGFLVQYGERVISATDLQVGENIGQNTPAETARTMNENGARVYSAIFKRTWRAMKDEFNVQFDLNRLYLEVDQDYTELTTGQGAMISPQDYLEPSITVRPAADPHVVSETQRIDQAKLVASNAMQIPGHNRYQSIKRLYMAMQVPNIDEILPPPQAPGPDGKPQPAADFPPMPNPKMMAAQLDEKKFQLDMMEFKANQMETKVSLMMDLEHVTAEIGKLNAQTTKLLAEAKGAEVEPQIKLLYAQIESEHKHRDRIVKMIDTISSLMQKQTGGDSGGNERTGLAGLGAGAANALVSGAVKGNGQAAPAGMVQ